jgi:hypothetical protein
MDIGLAIGIVVVLIILYLYDRFGRRRGPQYSLDDVEVTVTLDPVPVGDRTDIRFYFTVENPRKLTLRYKANLVVEGFPDVEQSNTFKQDSLRTFVPLFGARWDAIGAKKITGEVEVKPDGFSIPGTKSKIDAAVNVIER